MALIKCAECGKEFSDKAKACPNCACPLDEKTTKITFVREKIMKLSAVDINLFYDNDISIGTLKNNSSIEYDMPLGNHKLIIERVIPQGVYDISITGKPMSVNCRKERTIKNITIKEDGNKIFYFTPIYSKQDFDIESSNEISNTIKKEQEKSFIQKHKVLMFSMFIIAILLLIMFFMTPRRTFIFDIGLAVFVVLGISAIVLKTKDK